MSLHLTEAQRRVVESRGNVLVDAGAGSGKTTTVVHLLLHALGIPLEVGDGVLPGAAPALRLDQVAAITFTTASAADLTRKMRDALRRAGRADLATDVDAARLGTIHGFCGELLRAFALRANLPPVRRVLTEIEAKALASEAARERLHAALDARDIAGLDDLLGGRTLRDLLEWVTTLSQDTERLTRWRALAETSLRPHEEALRALAERAAIARVEHMQERGAIDFERMLVAARDMLRDDDVRRAVQRRLRLLVVDEFQDVDPVQQEIAMLLAGLERPDPSPTRIVLVGDPKQSIYRFRRADVTLWERTAERFRAGAGEVLPLHENFRSKAAILGFVDRVVGALMDRPLDAAAGRQPFEVAFSPLAARADHAEGDRCVELYVLPSGPKGPLTAKPVRAAEHPAIARRLQELHREERRPWGTMAVLVPSWTAADGIHAALSAAGIPSYVPRGEGFWESREVLDCLLLLRAVRDPSDDVAVIGLLKSPFVSVRDDTLLTMARVRHDGESLVQAAQRVLTDATVVAAERAALEGAVALLSRGAALRDRMAPAAYLDAVLRDTGYLAALTLDADGAQRIANLRKLLRLLDAQRDQSLGEFLREVRAAREREDKVASERLFGESGDVVTITTVHSAKGLEWDVVVLADLAAQFKVGSAAMIAARDTLAVKAVPLEGEKAADAHHDRVRAVEAMEEQAQRVRLWYVAATRAREKLLLFTLPLGDRKQPRSAACHFIAEVGSPEIGGEWRYVGRDGQSFTALVRMCGGVPRHEARGADAEPRWSLPPTPWRVPLGSARVSATQLMTFARDAAEWRRLYLHRVPDVSGSGSTARGAAAVQRAVVTGQIVHAVLEHLDGSALDVEALLEEAIGAWDPAAPSVASLAGARMRAALRERIDTVANADAWREMVGVKGARRELAFTRLLPDGTAVIGAMDLVAPMGDGVRVLDVKSSHADSETLGARYGIQAAVYVDAIRALSGHSRVEFVLLSAGDGAVTPVQPSGDVPSLVAALRG